ncbi:hypothetical protein Goshw_028788 [Gossypium schwendimanii]|uniref:Isopenicillin N synthase-like Fe(2+) 2OG dioxygenase domain-containing protein n=1 Tax=Gossypium schwendimanii TaxID=34291 RepID=A0A7J9N6N6_GOSSC|nr:hypothetical protein [Gossypium schwendimanii]
MAYTNDAEALQQWPIECRNLLEALLGTLGVELDNSKIDAFIEKKMVNMNFYPTCPNPKFMVGVGRHSDMVPEDVDMEKKGEWVEIPPIPGALIINVGDML